MAANPELRRADANQFLQGALENATHAIALHQSSLAAAGRADHRATGYLAKLFSLRARVYRDLYRNSDVLDEQSGQSSGQVIYLERCLSDAEQSLRYWDDPTNPATAIASVYWNLVHGGETNPLNSWTVPEGFGLNAQSTYYWRVRPRVQGDGTEVAWSTTWTFHTP